MKVLVVEDSERLRRSLEQGLTKSGYAVDTAADGDEGSAFLETYDYDIAILDLMLPGRSGLEVLDHARRAGNDVHILILSAKDQVEDRITGLDLGADDYLVKPFDFDELLARLQALVRRRHRRKSPCYTIGPLEVDSGRREIRRDGRPIHLTPTEYALFEVLAMRPGQTFSKDRLLERLYRSDAEVSPNVIEVLVSSLRRKLQRADEPPLIVTRRGHGYLVEDDRG